MMSIETTCNTTVIIVCEIKMRLTYELFIVSARFDLNPFKNMAKTRHILCNILY